MKTVWRYFTAKLQCKRVDRCQVSKFASRPQGMVPLFDFEGHSHWGRKSSSVEPCVDFYSLTTRCASEALSHAATLQVQLRSPYRPAALRFYCAR